MTEIATLINEGDRSPSQWVGTLADGTHFYVRYRGARIRIGFGTSEMGAIDAALYALDQFSVKGSYAYNRTDVDPLDGEMSWEEMLPYFEEAENIRHLDNCEVCKGARGGVRGNENRVDGKVVCDDCHVDIIDARSKP